MSDFKLETNVKFTGSGALTDPKTLQDVYETIQEVIRRGVDLREVPVTLAEDAMTFSWAVNQAPRAGSNPMLAPGGILMTTTTNKPIFPVVPGVHAGVIAGNIVTDTISTDTISASTLAEGKIGAPLAAPAAPVVATEVAMKLAAVPDLPVTDQPALIEAPKAAPAKPVKKDKRRRNTPPEGQSPFFPTQPTGRLPYVTLENADWLLEQPEGTYYLRLPGTAPERIVSKMRSRVRNAELRYNKRTPHTHAVVETSRLAAENALKVTIIKVAAAAKTA